MFSQEWQSPEWWEKRRTRLDRLLTAHNVSPRRAEVARRLCLGQSYKEIARDMGLTYDGVVMHTRFLFPRFDVRDQRGFRQTVAERLEGESPRPRARIPMYTELSTIRCEKARIASLTMLASTLVVPARSRESQRSHHEDAPVRNTGTNVARIVASGLRDLAPKGWRRAAVGATHARRAAADSSGEIGDGDELPRRHCRIPRRRPSVMRRDR